MTTIERLESNVRTYSRAFPTVFTSATGSRLTDQSGRTYLDFFSGAGALNYGHNNPRLKQLLLEYIESDGVAHSLDMATTAKVTFLERFDAVVLKPRRLDYKVQFAGPTGANAVEAALKLARKVTGRQLVIHFMNSYHGLSLGSLSVTASVTRRKSAGVSLHDTLPMFFDGDLGPSIDTLDYLEAFLETDENGAGIPAAIILETIQAEGGVKVATSGWLRRLERIARRFGIVLIVDDIQVGCGRTGDFFSFEQAGLSPDVICLSKSISGYGLPMSLVLIRPELDVWAPAEHTGTFRGNNLAYVTAAGALSYWQDGSFGDSIAAKSRQVTSRLEQIASDYPEAGACVRGRGLIQGLACSSDGLVRELARRAFANGLVIEACGPTDNVLKLLPPLTVTVEELEEGLAIIDACLKAVLEEKALPAAAAG